ncbi:MAG: Histidine triad (HIT) nucleotide-binding protein, similarity with At5g48545 and yeast YDL125C (HNT1) [uncultured Nocardioidaceae bacterium]|uniref:Histidine triad (HIT) nucleotide-binding protein, similarity with At5g48545 and yeast YDL125C (HNT1) n=1 Tax=uncultured Nocardioidaceae bacterium TaxID=253824 RepID=A0A6J4MBW5_9ACTN|nr:MAG: Histidine triad (HIT) nucleotide-binding protein, similarity with At5g48545 and yeast YDL125C (HNT1) [uncultured Nocardioidaceae bacterium]
MRRTVARVACVFCDIIAGRQPAHLVLDRELVVGFLDVRPVFKGHVLVTPRDHVDDLAGLPMELIEPFFSAVREVAAAVPPALDAQGTFVAMNNVVSQSVPHLHCHVVPRRRKDGLRGFFWPRTRYGDEEEAAEYATRIARSIEALG